VNVGQRNLPKQPKDVTQESTRLGQTIATAFLTVREEQILGQQGYDQGRQHPQTQMKRVELPGEGQPVQQKQNEYEERIHESKRGRFGKNASKKKIPESQQYMNEQTKLDPDQDYALREVGKLPVIVRNPSAREPS